MASSSRVASSSNQDYSLSCPHITGERESYSWRSYRRFPEIFGKILLIFHDPEAYLIPLPDPTTGKEERFSPGLIRPLPRAKKGGKVSFS